MKIITFETKRKIGFGVHGDLTYFYSFIAGIIPVIGMIISDQTSYILDITLMLLSLMFFLLTPVILGYMHLKGVKKNMDKMCTMN